MENGNKPAVSRDSAGVRILNIVLYCLAFIGLMSLFGAFNKNDSSSKSQTVDTNSSEVASTEPAPELPKGPQTSFSDGIWEVNADIKPGKYKGITDRSCYYARLSSLSGSGTDNIIDNNNVSGPVTIEILPTDVAFETNGCKWSIVE